MNVQTSAQKLIFSEEGVARQILKKMVVSYPERKYTLAKVSTGWQVVPITQCAPYMPPAVPLPVKKPALSKPLPASDIVLVEVPFKKETPAYWEIEHEKPWLHKSHIISSEVHGNKLQFTVAKKVAQKMSLPIKEAA
ncbi:MAG: hypothetical protein AAAC48_14640 [Phyllobacterium sp.]|uniref:hypothetical protein n=1 Tax=Phyllobacterium sp. TaxID=1871046 RepID=UPI0030F16B3B